MLFYNMETEEFWLFYRFAISRHEIFGVMTSLLTSNTEVIKCCKHGSSAQRYRYPMHENMGSNSSKLIISSDFGYIPNILTLSSIICADKRRGSCKISSQYFSKMLSIPRHLAYRPMPTKKTTLPNRCLLLCIEQNV